MSKFASLPDIDLSSVDVYETSSSPELRSVKKKTSNQDDDDDDDDDDISDIEDDPKKSGKRTDTNASTSEIDKKGLEADEAMRRFQGSVEIGSGSSSERRGYDDKDVILKESPASRLQRLRIEAAELQEELSGQPNEDTQAEQGASTGTKSILDQLRALQSDLDKVGATGQEEQRWRDAKRLLDTLQTGEGASTAQDGDGNRAGPSANPTPSVTLSTFEERLTHLEKVVGSNSGVLEESQSLSRPLLPTLARLEHLSTMLTQPRHMDAISKRVKVLVSELDRVHESRQRLQQQSPDDSSTKDLDPISVSKLNDLYALSNRLQPLLPLAPQLLNRLRSLATLHSDSSRFSSTLTRLEEEQNELKADQQLLKDSMNAVENSLVENQKKFNTNLETVYQRLEEVQKRISQLS
ncbi:unnamed protein product [Sympodiomycopsis kandeliae]